MPVSGRQALPLFQSRPNKTTRGAFVSARILGRRVAELRREIKGLAKGRGVAFELDEQLRNDTIPVGELSLSLLLLMDDRRFPWAILVPQRENLVDLHDMTPADRSRLFEEAARVSAALKKLAGATKTNVAALGNVVSQLHVHVIARQKDDDAWPRPVWGVGERLRYAEGEGEACAATLRTALGI